MGTYSGSPASYSLTSGSMATSRPRRSASGATVWTARAFGLAYTASTGSAVGPVHNQSARAAA